MTKLPCVCGRKRLIHYGRLRPLSTSLKCPNCGLQGDYGYTKRETYENWNKAVKQAIAEMESE